MKGVVPLYRALRTHLKCRKDTLAPMQLLCRLEDYLTKEFASVILTESDGKVLPIINAGSKPEGRRIDIALAEGRLMSGMRKDLTIRGFVELKYLRNRHRWGRHDANDETGVTLEDLRNQLRRVDQESYAGYGLNLRGTRGDTYGLVFVSYVRRLDDEPKKRPISEDEFRRKVVRAAKQHGLREASKKSPTLRKIYSDEQVALLGSEYRVSLYVGLWRL